MFCIKCGKSALSGMVFCAECYSKEEAFVTLPDVASFEICPSCGRIKKGAHWLREGTIPHISTELRRTARLPSGAFLRAFEVIGLNPEEHYSNVTVAMTVSRNGVEKAERKQMRIMIKGNTCPTCNRKSGHYFESTIQVRAVGRERADVILGVVEFIRKLCEEFEQKESDFFISSIKRTKGGADISLSSSTIGASVARTAAQRFGTDVRTTRKLYGQKDGRDVYRTTHLVRIPMLLRGDYVEYGGEYFRVRDTTDYIVLDPLGRGKQFTLDRKRAGNARYLGGIELEQEARVISRSAEYIVVKDPETMEEVKIPVFGGSDGAGSTVLVVRVGKLLFSVPAAQP